MSRPVRLAVLGTGLIGKRHVQHAKKSLVTGREGLNTLKVINSVKEAAATGQLVQVL